MKKAIRLGGLVSAALLASLIGNTGFTQEVIEKRQKLMERNADALRSIRAAAKEKDYGTIEVKAKEIAENMRKVPDLFPKGSVSKDSYAHPAIWDKWDEFSKSSKKMTQTAEELRKAATAKNEAEVGTKVKAIGGMSSGACGECHLSFNEKRMKKQK